MLENRGTYTAEGLDRRGHSMLNILLGRDVGLDENRGPRIGFIDQLRELIISRSAITNRLPTSSPNRVLISHMATLEPRSAKASTAPLI